MVSFRLRLSRRSNWLDVDISVSLKTEFEKFRWLHSGQAQ